MNNFPYSRLINGIFHPISSNLLINFLHYQLNMYQHTQNLLFQESLGLVNPTGKVNIPLWNIL